MKTWKKLDKMGLIISYWFIMISVKRKKGRLNDREGFNPKLSKFGTIHSSTTVDHKK